MESLINWIKSNNKYHILHESKYVSCDNCDDIFSDNIEVDSQYENTHYYKNDAIKYLKNFFEHGIIKTIITNNSNEVKIKLNRTHELVLFPNLTFELSNNKIHKIIIKENFFL